MKTAVPATTITDGHLGVADLPSHAHRAVYRRPLQPGDTDTVERVFAAMSAESRRLRFLAPVARLTARAARRLADVDHDREGCWVAIAADTPVGLGRYSRLRAEPDVAEVALEVVDAMQGRGIGKLLIAAIAAAAADVGVRSLTWTTDPANTAILISGSNWAPTVSSTEASSNAVPTSPWSTIPTRGTSCGWLAQPAWQRRRSTGRTRRDGAVAGEVVDL